MSDRLHDLDAVKSYSCVTIGKRLSDSIAAVIATCMCTVITPVTKIIAKL